MTVLKGEGRFSILYASTRLPLGRNLAAYLSRPDAAGAHPTVIVAHPRSGITAHVKWVCRHLARHGFAAICPDLHRGAPPGEEPFFDAAGDGRLRADLVDAFETADADGTEWSDASRIALLGIGDGARAAVVGAPAVPGLSAVALAGPSLLTPGSGTSVPDGLALVDADVFAVVGEDDERAAAGLVEEARRAAPDSVWAVYRGVGAGFLDESEPGYDPEAARDAWRRIIEFLERRTG